MRCCEISPNGSQQAGCHGWTGCSKEVRFLTPFHFQGIDRLGDVFYELAETFAELLPYLIEPITLGQLGPCSSATAHDEACDRPLIIGGYIRVPREGYGATRRVDNSRKSSVAPPWLLEDEDHLTVVAHDRMVA